MDIVDALAGVVIDLLGTQTQLPYISNDSTACDRCLSICSICSNGGSSIPSSVVDSDSLISKDVIIVYYGSEFIS